MSKIHLRACQVANVNNCIKVSIYTSEKGELLLYILKSLMDVYRTRTRFSSFLPCTMYSICILSVLDNTVQILWIMECDIPCI